MGECHKGRISQLLADIQVYYVLDHLCLLSNLDNPYVMHYDEKSNRGKEFIMSNNKTAAGKVKAGKEAEKKGVLLEAHPSVKSKKPAGRLSIYSNTGRCGIIDKRI